MLITCAFNPHEQQQHMFNKRGGQAVDKATGKQLVPVQVWLLPRTKKALEKIAAGDDYTAQQFLRKHLENIAETLS